MKAKIYTDGINGIGGFRKSKNMRNFWVIDTVELAEKQIEHLERYGFVNIQYGNTPIVVSKNVNAQDVYVEVKSRDCVRG